MHKGLFIVVYSAGVYNVLMAAFHAMFWNLKFFNWAEELPRMSLLNSGVMQIMNLCLMVILLITAFVLFFHTNEMITTSLGKSLLIGFSALWLFRLILQFAFFGYRGMLYPAVFSVGFLVYFIPSVILLAGRK